MWCWRKMLSISWQEHRTNDSLSCTNCNKWLLSQTVIKNLCFVYVKNNKLVHYKSTKFKMLTQQLSDSHVFQSCNCCPRCCCCSWLVLAVPGLDCWTRRGCPGLDNMDDSRDGEIIVTRRKVPSVVDAGRRTQTSVCLAPSVSVPLDPGPPAAAVNRYEVLTATTRLRFDCNSTALRLRLVSSQEAGRTPNVIQNSWRPWLQCRSALFMEEEK